MTRQAALRSIPMGAMTIEDKKTTAAGWFRTLRDDICAEFEKIEAEYSPPLSPPRAGGIKRGERDAPCATASTTFTRTPWHREQGGGGEIAIMKGRVFEKVGVNISTVEGEFSEQFRNEIPGAAEDPRFWASGISLVAHMRSPLVPAAHFNTRMIIVGDSRQSPVASRQNTARREEFTTGDRRLVTGDYSRLWFGGGGDLNPMFPNDKDTAYFHSEFKKACDAMDMGFYPAFKGWCDEYFYIPHRNEARGVGGIFYDYLGLNTLASNHSPRSAQREQRAAGVSALAREGGVSPPSNQPLNLKQFGKGGVGKELTQKGMELAANAALDWQSAFTFTQAVGRAFLTAYPTLIREHMYAPWTSEQREHQLLKRGRYAEYNLLYDRGTRFGLMTGGNPEAILMSLPPEAKWA